jgi:sporulation protein YlmC with PRC-barrel domain
MNRFVLTSVAAAVMAIGTQAALAQAPSQPQATPQSPASSTTTRTTPPVAAPATRDSMPGTPGKTTNYTGMNDSKTWERTHRVSKIIGTDVVNSKGEKIGDVEDIVLDAKGNVAYAVVSTGGFLGMGDKMHAVPWAAIRTSTGTDNFMLDVDKERLRSAPGFDQSNWPNVNDAKWSSENRRYFPASGTTRSSTTPAATSSGGSK